MGFFEKTEFPWHYRLPLTTQENCFILVEKRTSAFDYPGEGYQRQIEGITIYKLFCNLTNKSVNLQGIEVIQWMQEHCGTLFMPTVLARCTIIKLK